MSTKYRILEALERKRGQFVSGEELAKALNISRSAVAKGVASLKSEGLSIQSVTGVGHRLLADADLTEQGIRKYLENGAYDIRSYGTLTSTLDEARKLAADGAKEWTVVVALEQSAGRGRLGRKFCSPRGAGVYFTIIVRPSPNKVPYLTSLTAVAVAEGIERAGGKHTSIKWVNDVFADGKKCCGILTEAVSDLECGGVEFAAIGIGVNVRTPVGGFPEEIKDIASAALDGVEDAHNKVVAAILDRFFELYTHFDKADIAARYGARSFLTGMTVKVSDGKGERLAKVLGTDGDCRLLVRYDSGEEEALIAGEVSVKW